MAADPSMRDFETCIWAPSAYMKLTCPTAFDFLDPNRPFATVTLCCTLLSVVPASAAYFLGKVSYRSSPLRVADCISLRQCFFDIRGTIVNKNACAD